MDRQTDNTALGY